MVLTLARLEARPCFFQLLYQLLDGFDSAVRPAHDAVPPADLLQGSRADLELLSRDVHGQVEKRFHDLNVRVNLLQRRKVFPQKDSNFFRQ